MSALAEMERAIIAERQKDVHRERRDQGLIWGKDIGPRKRVTKEIEDRVLLERNKGASLRQIASTFNKEGIPTVLGKLWTASTVKHVINHKEDDKE
jgi:DNA invertase Pin-like site-specific DNA recombinase